MSTTKAKLKEYTDETTTDCEYDWCPGATSETLPCFDCFDPDRQYRQFSSDTAEATADAEAEA